MAKPEEAALLVHFWKVARTVTAGNS